MISSKFYDFIYRYFHLTKIKVFIRYLDLRLSLEYFDLLSSVSNSNMV